MAAGDRVERHVIWRTNYLENEKWKVLALMLSQTKPTILKIAETKVADLMLMENALQTALNVLVILTQIGNNHIT